MFNNRQQYQDFTTLFQFLSSELSSLPCLNYKTDFVRAFNALPTDVKLDVYIEDKLLAKELAYKEFSYYVAASALKVHNIKVFISNELDNPILETQVEIHEANVETFCIVGSIENPSILMITGDPPQQIYHNKSVIRYVNLTEQDITVNVIRSKNITRSKIVESNEYVRYETIDPGIYNFQFVSANTSGDTFQNSTIHELHPTRIYTFYLVGSTDINSSYPFELVISVDVTTLLKPCPTTLKRF